MRKGQQRVEGGEEGLQPLLETVWPRLWDSVWERLGALPVSSGSQAELNFAQIT